MNLLVLAILLAQDPPLDRPTQMPKPPEKEVVIIGSRHESDILDVPSSVSVITAEQISKSGATDIVAVLRSSPGFFAQGSHFGAADKLMDLRGYNNGAGNGQRTLVLVDGRKTNNVASSATDWAAIPVANIERIEIVRGPASAIYGDTALAGVVNIVTKKGSKEPWTRIGAAAGNWGSWRTSVGAGQIVEGVRFDVIGSMEGTQGWRDNSDYRGNDVTGRFEFPIQEGLSGYIKLGHHDDQRERPGTLTSIQMQTLGRKASTTIGNQADVNENYVDGGLTQALGELGTLSLLLNVTQYNSDAIYTDFGGFQSQDETEIALLQLKHVVVPKLFGREAVFTTGLDVSTEFAEAWSQSTGFAEDESEYRRRLIGLYHHAEVRPFEWLVAAASLRYDRALLDLDREAPSGFSDNVDEQKNFDFLNPHAGLTFKILDELSAYTSWGRTFRFPTRDELIGFLNTDPQLKPERASTFEVGTRYRSGTWGSAALTWFYMDVKDEIYFDPIAGTFNFGNNLNFDEVVHQGIEGELRVSPVQGVEFFGGYTLTRVVIEDSENPAEEGKTYPVTPKYAATVGTSVSALGAIFTVSGRYIGERYLIRDFENTGDKIADVFVYDTKISYTYKSATAFVSVYNLTNREYEDSGGFSSFGPIKFNAAPERSWLIGGELTF